MNPDVNGHWMCDDGRYDIARLDAGRLGKVVRLAPSKTELSWADMAAELAGVLRSGIAKNGPDGLAVVASGALSNEDWDAYKAFFVDELKLKSHYFSAEPDQVGEEDALLRRREKVPNLKGAEARGLKSGSFDELKKRISDGKVWGLYVIERDLAKIWGGEAKALLSKVGATVLQGPNKYELGDDFAYRLPATAYVEEEGHFTNFEGKAQKYHAALDPIGSARPDHEIFALLGKAVRAASAEVAA